jgi:pyruvate dehydrogenase E1 component
MAQTVAIYYFTGVLCASDACPVRTFAGGREGVGVSTDLLPPTGTTGDQPAVSYEAETAALESIQRRVLWLSVAIVHHANRVRPNLSGLKVGGHQASSASMVSLMTALWFRALRRDDRVSVKPHASPTLHAINYLLGWLDRDYLTKLRELKGLQSYPSRTKDPDPIDYSTGSVGLGATAPIWGAIARRYLNTRLGADPGGRQIALIGDAELDEGACWEAVVDPGVARLGEVTWIVDLNRQSLDRVVPGMAVKRLESMFEAAGWQCLRIKYGRRLERLFQGGGEALRGRIDAMPNEEYQRLLRCDAGELRERLPGEDRGRKEIRKQLNDIPDRELLRTFRDLGGHDLVKISEVFDQIATDRPSVVFAYTIKGWGLPTEGHPANHSALLNDAEYEALADELGADLGDPWAGFADGTPEAELCRRAAERLRRNDPEPRAAPPVPVELGRRRRGHESSTQREFGRFLGDLSRDAPEVSERVVTVSADVASSTNLGGWINRVGVWSPADRVNWFEDDSNSLVQWNETDHGQHIELGIAETSLVGLLGELGSTWREGDPLLPIGTLYDPFVGRALEPWSFGIYSGGQSILAGTPSGISLAPEGGAHQSVITPSIGIAQPGCIAWEPAFGIELEWCMLDALSRLGKPDGLSAYIRLSTRTVDQRLAALPTAEAEREQRRRDVLSGGYALRRADRSPLVVLVGVGAVMPEVLGAAAVLDDSGIACDVLCLTSPDLVFRAAEAIRGLGDESAEVLDRLLPPDRAAPIVSVVDGHPHSLAFLGGIRRQEQTALGVRDFGQSGTLEDLYEVYGLDTETILGAALDLVE